MGRPLSIPRSLLRGRLFPKELSKEMISRIYASEADILNVALFGTTAKEWELANPKSKGNIRDYASGVQLVRLNSAKTKPGMGELY